MRGWQLAAVVAIATVLLLVLGIRALLGGRRVPAKAKLAIAGAVVWLLSPIDVIPDVVPAVGVFDDVAVLIAVIKYVLDRLQPAEPLQRRLDQHQAIEATNWRITDEDPPGRR